MSRSQQLRGALLDPFLHTLSRTGLRAGHVTAAGFALGLLFAPLYVFDLPALALLALALHVTLDAVDGPLARHQRADAPRGAFADAFSDQIVVATTTLAMVIAQRAEILPGVLFLLSYTLVVAFALVRNALKVPYTWLVRPRFAVYAWIAVDRWLVRGTFDAVLWLFTLLLLWKVATGFVRIRRALP